MGDEFADSVEYSFGPRDDDNSVLKRTLDFLIYVVGIVGPGMALPTVFEIWSTQSGSAQNAVTWVLFGLFAPFWILYGVVHKKPPIVVTYTCWLLVALAIVVGSLMYS